MLKCIKNCCVSENVILFRFPKDPKLLEMWKYNLDLPKEFKVGPLHRVCSQHFAKEWVGRRKLLKGAVPTEGMGSHKKELLKPVKFSNSNRRCAVKGCSNFSVKCRMFSFPKYPRYFELWKTLCQVEQPITQPLYICENHFERQYVGRQKLMPGIMPTKNLPPGSVVPAKLMCLPASETSIKTDLQILYENGKEASTLADYTAEAENKIVDEQEDLEREVFDDIIEQENEGQLEELEQILLEEEHDTEGTMDEFEEEDDDDDDVADNEGVVSELFEALEKCGDEDEEEEDAEQQQGIEYNESPPFTHGPQKSSNINLHHRKQCANITNKSKPNEQCNCWHKFAMKERIYRLKIYKLNQELSELREKLQNVNEIYLKKIRKLAVHF